MKTIFLMLITAVLFCACGKDAIPIPESLLIEETDLTFVAEGETYLDRVYTTAEGPIELIIPENAKEWLAVSLKDKHLEIIADRNASISPRTSSILVKTRERSSTIKITQTGLPTRKLKIMSGSASSAQSDGPVFYSFDGDYNTMWHSMYSPTTTQYQDHWIQYDLEPGSENLDLITLFPRTGTGRGNGRWGWYCIYVKGDGTSTPGEVPGNVIPWGAALGSVDAEGYKLMYKGDNTPYLVGYNITSIVLPVPVANPTAVKILINGSQAAIEPYTGGSQGGFGSLAEIELYGKVN